MHYSRVVEKAVRKTAALHDGQHRKGDLLPTLSHVFAVALILTDYTDDEDIIASALLHDTIEDTMYGFDELENDFGPRICTIVRGVTILDDDGTPKNWKERHLSYIQTLEAAPAESAYVAAADKIHNIRSMVLWYKGAEDHEFHHDFGGTNKERTEIYKQIRDIIARKVTNKKLLEEYDKAFEEYTEFLSR